MTDSVSRNSPVMSSCSSQMQKNNKEMLIDILIIILKIFLIIFPLLISIAYLTFFEEK